MHDAQLDQAYAARQAGQDQTAVAICQKILAADPEDRGAQSLLGVCMAEAGDRSRSRALIEQAVTAEPDNWRFLLNLAVLHEIEERPGAAVDCARRAAANAPERFEPWAHLGALCARQGDFAGADVALGKALAITDHPGLALLLAGAAYETGQCEKAALVLERIEYFAPVHRDVFKLRTHLARRSGNMDAVVDAATKWLAADPASDAARVALAHGYAQRDDYHRAIEVYRPLVEGNVPDAERAATFARYLLWARDFETAEQYYQRALTLRPDHADAAAGLARLNIYKGRLADAADLARRAIGADPANVEGYSQLAVATDAQLTDGQLDAVRVLAADAAIGADNRAVAWFTVADVRHKRGDREGAFGAWKQANDLKREAAARWAGSSYDPRETEDLVDRLAANFNAFPPATARPALAGPTPLFIVGMPRSGTTLIDGALAGHTDIVSGGELPFMPAALNKFLAWAQGAGWRGGAIPDPFATQLRGGYLRQYGLYRIADAAFVTDKQPLNFWSVGLIRHLFPTAPIVHIRRNALEVGFSIYRNNFTRAWSFATSLADIGHYYGQYMRMMAHWQAVLGNGMATVQYEALVGDFEGEMRRLLAQFGTDWDPGCLVYYERESIVTTLSSTQIRKPPSKNHLDSTTPYAAMLAPLRDALERAGVNWDTNIAAASC